MKKPFILAAAVAGVLAAAAPAVLAQSTAEPATPSKTPIAPLSSVQLYGLVDLGINHIRYQGSGSSTQLVSGIMEGSRIGFRGNEDLGGGWRAIFTLENRLEADTGATSNRPPSGSQLPDRVSTAAALGLPRALQPVVTGVAASIGSTVGVNLNNAFFDRQAYVGLVTPVGAVLAGRQYTPAYEVSAAYDSMHTESSLAAGQVLALPAGVDIRSSNALQYRIQAAGVTAGVMYALGEAAGSNRPNRLWGAMGMYKNDIFSIGAGYNTRNNEQGNKSLTTSLIGASAKVGPGTISTFVGKIKDDNPTGLSGIATGLASVVPAATAAAVQSAFVRAFRQDGQLFHLGYRLEVTPANTVTVAYTRYNDKRPSNADVASYGVAYTYALSKRTDLNAVATHFNNKNLAQASPGQAGFGGGVARIAGQDSNSFAFGIRHRF